MTGIKLIIIHPIVNNILLRRNVFNVKTKITLVAGQIIMAGRITKRINMTINSG
jgi:hypothetical protein